MTKPVLFIVDDETVVLRAVERDLRRQYGQEYRIVSADSGQAALGALEQLKVRNTPVALFLVDQRMPEMTGIEFLEAASQLYPNARRVLLTAYADTDVAIRAINKLKLDYYLLKPWDPPEENLYPVLTDLLYDWQGVFRPPFEGIRVIGHRWSPETHQVKDFLARNLVPYRWLDVETDAEARDVLSYADLKDKPLPVVLFPDGSHLARPATAEIAEKVGLNVQAERPFYDLIIVGGGPAGLAAAVYGASEGLRTLLIEREAPGGQAGTSARIENYLGFPQGVSGSDLTRRAVTQANRFGAEILTAQEVVAVRVQDVYRIVELADGSEVSCYALLIGTGVSYRPFEAPGVERLTGAGVYYGAAQTEAVACIDHDVFIVGAGNSAGQAAMYLARYAHTVTLLVRGESLAATMSHYLIGQIEETPNIQVRLQTVVREVHGENRLESVTIEHVPASEVETLPASALFIFIGAVPRTDWVPAEVERDERGFILTGADVPRHGRPRSWTLDRAPYLLETSVPGIFVAGDVRHGSVKRVASAVGEGAIAVRFVHEYLSALQKQE